MYYKAVGLSGKDVVVGGCSTLLAAGAGWAAAAGPCNAVATAVGSIAFQNITSSLAGAGAAVGAGAGFAFAATAFAVARAAARAAALSAGLVPIVGAGSDAGASAGSGSGIGRGAVTPTDAAGPARIDSTCPCGFIPALGLLGDGADAATATSARSLPVVLLVGLPIGRYWCTCEVESDGCSGLWSVVPADVSDAVSSAVSSDAEDK